MKNIFAYDGIEPLLSIEPEIMLSGNRVAYIDGVKEIIACSPDTLTLSLKENTLSFHGSGIEIASFESERLVLTGDILSLSFSS